MSHAGSDFETTAAAPQRSAVTLAGLGRLFVKPAEFFRDTELQPGWLWLAAVWLVGIDAVFDRIDRKLMQSDLGSKQDFGQSVVQSWPSYWGIALFGGLVAGAMIWFFGGLWYRLRLGFAGATLPDPREARLVYTFAGLVGAVPSILLTAFYTWRFPNYLAAWQSEDLLTSVLNMVPLGFLIWSFVVNYRGVLARFEVNLWPARLWFLILPVVLMLAMTGVIGALYAYA